MRQSKAEIYLHLIWATLRREPLLTLEIERAVYRCIEKEALKLGCQVLALCGMPDHVHLCVKLPTSLTISRLANQVKGVSSHILHDNSPEPNGFAWQEGYGVFSISPNQVHRVIAYIENQKQHHADLAIYPLWEETD